MRAVKLCMMVTPRFHTTFGFKVMEMLERLKFELYFLCIFLFHKVLYDSYVQGQKNTQNVFHDFSVDLGGDN